MPQRRPAGLTSVCGARACGRGRGPRQPLSRRRWCSLRQPLRLSHGRWLRRRPGRRKPRGHGARTPRLWRRSNGRSGWLAAAVRDARRRRQPSEQRQPSRRLGGEWTWPARQGRRRSCTAAAAASGRAIQNPCDDLARALDGVHRPLEPHDILFGQADQIGCFLVIQVIDGLIDALPYAWEQRRRDRHLDLRPCAGGRRGGLTLDRAPLGGG